nr:hypothetical protein [Candidatus Bathyarchaeota archaeon]
AIGSDLLSNRVHVQTQYIDELEKLYSESLPIVKLPLQGFEVKGLKALRRIEKLLYP